MTKYYKITFADGEEWKCFTEDNIEYKSHGIMWTSSLTSAPIPLWQVLETLSNLLDDKMVESIIEIDCNTYLESIRLLIDRKYELYEEQSKLVRQLKNMQK